MHWIYVAAALSALCLWRWGRSLLPRDNWPPHAAAGALVLGAVLLWAVAGFLVASVARILPAAWDERGVLLVARCATVVAAVVALVWAQRQDRSRRALAWPSAKVWGGALLLYLGMQPIARAALGLSTAGRVQEGEAAPIQPTLQKFLTAWAEGDLLGWASIAFPVVFCVPILEEIVFRALLTEGIQAQLQRSLGGRRAEGVALVGGALVFAVVHHGFAFLPVLVFGLLLGWVWLRTRSLLLVIGLHALHNGATLLEHAWAAS